MQKKSTLLAAFFTLALLLVGYSAAPLMGQQQIGETTSPVVIGNPCCSQGSQCHPQKCCAAGAGELECSPRRKGYCRDECGAVAVALETNETLEDLQNDGLNRTLRGEDSGS